MGTLSQGVLAIAALALSAAACGSPKPAVEATPVGIAPAPSVAAPPKGPTTNEERRQQIHALLHDNRDVYRTCFRDAHNAHNEIDYVNITIVVTLKPTGEIVSVTRQEGTPEEQTMMMGCINQAVRSITFPRHPKGKETTVRYPLSFSSGK